MAPQRSSHVHPLSLTQRQCQMLLMLGAPVYLPRPRLWTWVTLHKFSIGLLLTFPWPYCHIVELTPRIHLCDYVCQVVPRDSLSAQRARAQVCLERTMKKKSTSTMSTLLWLFIACASKNLDVFELFSGTGKIHAQARLNLRNWLLLWMLMAPKLCNVKPVKFHVKAASLIHWGKGNLRRCWPQIFGTTMLCISMCKWIPKRTHCQTLPLSTQSMYLICSSRVACAEWLLRLDPQTECKQHRINALFSDMFVITHIVLWPWLSGKNMWLWLQKYQYWGRVFSMHFVKCSASKLVGFCLWEFPVHCWFSSA